MWGLIGLAAASSEVDMAALVREVAPSVEEVAGRTFLALPDVATVNAALALDHLTDSMLWRQTMGLREPSEQERAEARVQAVRFLDPLVAAYVTDTRSIYIVQDRLTPLVRVLALEASEHRELLRCLMAHELTHALQDQYVDADLTNQDPEAHALVREGQAALVAQRICSRPTTAALLNTVTGADILSSQRLEGLVVRYGMGERFMTWVADHYGMEGTWAAVQTPPPVAEVMALMRGSVVEGWADPGPAEQAVRTLVAAPQTPAVNSRPFSPYFLLAALQAGPLAGAPPLHAVGGTLAWVGQDLEVAPTRVFVGLVASPQDASAWLQHRFHQVEGASNGGGMLNVFTPSDLRIQVMTQTWDRSLQRTLGADRALHVRLEGARRYDEHWVAAGHRVAAVFSTGTPASRSTLKRSLTGLLAALPDRPPPARPPMTTSWTPGAVPVTPAYTWYFRQAVQAAMTMDFARCQEASTHTLSLMAADHPNRLPVQAVAWACAIERGDLAAADALVTTLLEWPDFDRTHLPQHAQLRLEANRPDDAIALLLAMDTQDPSLLKWIGDLRLERAWRSGDYATAARLARAGQGPPGLRMAICQKLLIRGRYDEALAIMKVTCGELPDVDRGRCTALYTSLLPD